MDAWCDLPQSVDGAMWRLRGDGAVHARESGSVVVRGRKGWQLGITLSHWIVEGVCVGIDVECLC